MSVPFANWAGTERDWGCPSTWSLPNKDIHSVPGSLAQGRGRLCWLCALRLPCPLLTPGQHQELHPAGSGHHPSFCGLRRCHQSAAAELPSRRKTTAPKRSADRKDTCFLLDISPSSSYIIIILSEIYPSIVLNVNGVLPKQEMLRVLVNYFSPLLAVPHSLLDLSYLSSG